MSQASQVSQVHGGEPHKRAWNLRVKLALSLCLVVFVAGCARQPSSTKSDGCCGLTRAQWTRYDERAAAAVLDPAAWKKVGSKQPGGVQPTAHTDLFGTSNSPDGERPPSEVTVHVPIGSSVPGCTDVVVTFSHPDGKIRKMQATTIYYD